MVFMKKYLLALLSFLIISGSGFAQCPGTSLQAGIIGTDQTICMGSTPATLIQIQQPTNVTGSLTYSWQQSFSISGPWTTISGATNASYTPMPLINTIYFRRVDTDQGAAAPCNVATSNPVTIRVSNINPGTIGTDQTVCYNTVPVTFTEITAASNLTGPPTYSWEASSSNILGSFVTIPGATNANYTPPVALTQDVYVRRVVTDPTKPSPCNTATSNTVHITVLPQVTAGTIGDDQTICAGAAPVPITSTSLPTGGSSIYTYQWQMDLGSGMSNIVGATNATYAPYALTATTKFRRIETSGVCAYVISNTVTVTVTTPAVVSVTITDPGPVCSGTNLTFTATGVSSGGGSVSYQWYLDATPVGSNSPTYAYTPQSSDKGKTVKVVVSTSYGCDTGPATSNIVALDVVPSTTPTVTIMTSNNPSCAGLPVTFTSSTTGGGSSPTYQWHVNGVSVSGATNSTFTTTSLVNGDQVWVELMSMLNCIIGTNPFASNRIFMVVKPIPVPVINEGDQTVCAGNSFKYTSTVSVGTVYQWEKDGVAIPGATNDTYTANQLGVYTLYEDNQTCNSSSAPAMLTIDPCGGFSTSISGPNPITAGQQNAVYSVFNQAGFTYEWSITGGTIVSGQNTNSVMVDWDPAPVNAIARTTIPVYSISVKETKPSKQSKTTTLNVNELTTGVTKSLAQAGITLFPNPTAESFSIEMPESGIAVNYEIVDLTGLSVAQGNFISSGTAEKITTDFGAGIYQVILRYNNTVTCGRLSKV
jgi:hypothetical protein